MNKEPGTRDARAAGEPTPDKKIYIVDIDGTICEHIGNEEGVERMRDARPIRSTITAINAFYDDGHYICFFTSRLDEHERVTREWLASHGVKYHQLIMNKPRRAPPFTEYHFIDDTHVRATTFRGEFTKLVKKNVEVEVFDG